MSRLVWIAGSAFLHILFWGVWTHDHKYPHKGLEPRTIYREGILGNICPLTGVKSSNGKNAAPPEMAGVPLPTCSGARAIHDSQLESMVLWLHPVPYGENRDIISYKLEFYYWCNKIFLNLCFPNKLRQLLLVLSKKIFLTLLKQRNYKLFFILDK